jgi:integrase/recombinase XerD
MTPLRQRMTEDMQLRGLAPATQQAYLRYLEQLALFTGKSPDLATDEDFRQFFLALHPALAAAPAPAPPSPSR